MRREPDYQARSRRTQGHAGADAGKERLARSLHRAEAVSNSAAALEGHAAEKGPWQRADRDRMIALMPSLRAFAHSLTRDAIEADDLVQETLTRALGNLHQFTPGTNLKAWLFKIQRNAFYSNYRKRHREIMVPQEDLGCSIQPEQEWSLKVRDLHNALQQIPEDQKEALLLVSGADLSYEEAAEICDCALGTIKSRVSRARARLLFILQVDDYEDFLRDEAKNL